MKRVIKAYAVIVKDDGGEGVAVYGLYENLALFASEKAALDVCDLLQGDGEFRVQHVTMTVAYDTPKKRKRVKP